MILKYLSSSARETNIWFRRGENSLCLLAARETMNRANKCSSYPLKGGSGIGICDLQFSPQIPFTYARTKEIILPSWSINYPTSPYIIRRISFIIMLISHVRWENERRNEMLYSIDYFILRIERDLMQSGPIAGWRRRSKMTTILRPTKGSRKRKQTRNH